MGVAPGVEANAQASDGRAEARSDDWLISACGGLLVVVYAAATARMPLQQYFDSAIGVTVDFVYMLGPTWQYATAAYVSFVLVTFALYGAALWRVRTRPLHPVLLFGFPVLFALALLLMYPPTAVDMFHYQAMGRVFWVFDANPLTEPQGRFPYPVNMSWWDLPSPYGPAWSLLVGPVSKVPDYLAGLYAMKAMMAIAYLACTAMIWWIVRRTRPGEETFAVVLFAWNPFVALRAVGNGHNDMWMLLGVLLCIAAVWKRWWMAAVIALSLGVLIKFIPALLGLPLLLYIWTHAGGSVRARLFLLVQLGVVALLLAVALYAPFWAGLETFDTIRNESSRMITSTPVLVQLYLGDVIGAEAAESWASRGPRFVFLVLYPFLAWQARRDFGRFVVFSATILFLYLVIAAAWFRPWYMLWPLTLFALRPRGWTGALVVTISLAAAFPDLVEQFRIHWPFLAGSFHRQVAAPILLAFVPPLLVWLVAIVRTRGWSLGAGSAGAPALRGLPSIRGE